MDFRLIKPEDRRELKSASEMDDSTIKSIQDEYFKRTFVYSIIGVFIATTVVALWLFGVIKIPRVTGLELSDVISLLLMFLVAFSGGMAGFLIYRCIFALIIASKIKKQLFLWGRGFIRDKEWKYPGTWGRKQIYYSVDDKYFAQVSVNPKYRKGTEVYFLRFPGYLSETSSIGGAVVRINPAAAVND